MGRLYPLLFLRDATDWLNSFYNQLIKAHRVPWADIAGFSIDDPKIQSMLSIDEHLERWAERCVSASDLSVVKYGRDMDLQRVFETWTGRVLGSTYCGANPNPAADLSSLRILSEVKRRVAGSDQQTLVRVMNAAHARLKRTWIDTQHASAPVLLTEAEQRALKAKYEPAHNQLLKKFGQGPGNEMSFRILAAPVSRNILESCSDREGAEADDILRIAGFY